MPFSRPALMFQATWSGTFALPRFSMLHASHISACNIEKLRGYGLNMRLAGSEDLLRMGSGSEASWVRWPGYEPSQVQECMTFLRFNK